MADHLYPIFNSVLQSRFQDNNPLDWSYFLESSWSLILDLVASSSYIQIVHELKRFPYFLSVYSPTSIWINGEKVLSRRLCADIYFRWNSYSNTFFCQYRELIHVSMLQCLLDHSNDDVISTVRQSLDFPDADRLSLLCLILEQMSSMAPLQGILRFLDKSISDAPVAAWSSYSIFLCQSMQILADKCPDIFTANKLTLPMILFKILSRATEAEEVDDKNEIVKLLLIAVEGLKFADITTIHVRACLKALNDFSQLADNLQRIKNSEVLTQLIPLVVRDNLTYFAHEPHIMKLCCQCVLSAHLNTEIFCQQPTTPLAETFLEMLQWALSHYKTSLSNAKNNPDRIVDFEEPFSNFQLTSEWIQMYRNPNKLSVDRLSIIKNFRI